MVGIKGIKSHRKGLTYEKEYGIDRAKEIKEKSSKSHILISDITWAMRKWFKGRIIKNKSRFVKGNEPPKHKENCQCCRCTKISHNKGKKLLYMVGENNPAKKTEIGKKISLAKLGKERLDMIGNKNPAWLGGKSFEPYTPDFNKKFKEAIKERDNYCCVVCNKHQSELKIELCIHHVDYNKINTLPQNCLSLCQNCHLKTNLNRNSWKLFFQSLLKERYGYEYTIDQKIILDFDKGDV